MKCDRYRHMLYLYRDGELSRREAEELRQHMRECESCRMEGERISVFNQSISHLRTFRPVYRGAHASTTAILARVRSSANPAAAGFTDRLLDLFILPRVRIASASFIMVAVGLFLFQYSTFFWDIQSLEVAATARSNSTSHSEVLYSVASPELLRLVESKDVRNLIPAGQYKIVQGQILVPRNNVSSLLSVYDLRSVTSFVTSTVLHVDKARMDSIIDDVSRNCTTMRGF